MILSLWASSISFISRLFSWAFATSYFNLITYLILCLILSYSGPIRSFWPSSMLFFYSFSFKFFLKLYETMGKPLYFQLFHLKLLILRVSILWNLLLSIYSHLMVEYSRMLSLDGRSKTIEPRWFWVEEGAGLIVQFIVEPVYVIFFCGRLME